MTKFMKLVKNDKWRFCSSRRYERRDLFFILDPDFLELIIVPIEVIFGGSLALQEVMSKGAFSRLSRSRQEGHFELLKRISKKGRLEVPAQICHLENISNDRGFVYTIPRLTEEWSNPPILFTYPNRDHWRGFSRKASPPPE